MGKAQRFVESLRAVAEVNRLPVGRGRNTVGLLGLGVGAGGTARGPQRIRQALRERELCTEEGRAVRFHTLGTDGAKAEELAKVLNDEQSRVDLSVYNVVDLGDMEFDPDELSPNVLEERISAVMAVLNRANITPVTLGGDASVTPLVYKGLLMNPRIEQGHVDSGDSKGGQWAEQSDAGSARLPHILHFSAEPRMREPAEAGGAESAFKDLVESEMYGMLTQFCLRRNSINELKFVRDYPAVEQFRMDEWHRLTPAERFDGIFRAMQFHINTADTASRTYFSFDANVFDPVFAPAVPNPIPGGVTPRELLHQLQQLPLMWRHMGLDIVGYCPDKDPDGATANLLAHFLLETFARLSLRNGEQQEVHAKETSKGLQWPWMRRED